MEFESQLAHHESDISGNNLFDSQFQGIEKFPMLAMALQKVKDNTIEATGELKELIESNRGTIEGFQDYAKELKEQGYDADLSSSGLMFARNFTDLHTTTSFQVGPERYGKIQFRKFVYDSSEGEKIGLESYVRIGSDGDEVGKSFLLTGNFISDDEALRLSFGKLEAELQNSKFEQSYRGFEYTKIIGDLSSSFTGYRVNATPLEGAENVEEIQLTQQGKAKFFDSDGVYVGGIQEGLRLDTSQIRDEGFGKVNFFLEAVRRDKELIPGIGASYYHMTRDQSTIYYGGFEVREGDDPEFYAGLKKRMREGRFELGLEIKDTDLSADLRLYLGRKKPKHSLFSHAISQKIRSERQSKLNDKLIK